MTKISPKEQDNIFSGTTLESEQHTTSKDGCCPLTRLSLVAFNSLLLSNSDVCLKDIHLDNVRIFGQGVRKFVHPTLYTVL